MSAGRISSRQNPVVKAAAALIRDAEKRKAEEIFLCEGARLCRDAALSGIKIRTLFYTQAAFEKYSAYIEEILKRSGEAYLIGEHIAPMLSDTKSPQGIFCVCESPKETSLDEVFSKGVRSCAVLENLQDPGNLGTVLRTAEAFGVEPVILLNNCCDALSPKAIRASMGAVFRLPVIKVQGAGRLCEELKARGIKLHAAVVPAGAAPLTSVSFSGGAHAVFIGNEGNGLSKETVSLCDDSITIPMSGRAESLNASAAATVLLWELVRNKRK